VAFSPDGKLVASGSINRTIRHWEAETAAFYPDGKLVTSGSDDGTIRLWDAATGALQQTLEGHSDLIWAVAFSPDGNLVASSSDDGTIKLWDAVTGALQQTLEVDAGIRRLSFSKFGPYLETDRGLLRFQTTHFGILPQQSELISDIFVKERWVARDMEKLLWLPPDYRPRHAAVYGRVVALGHVSGRVLILEFSF
jgi:WD40 repeat protein